MKKAVLRSGLLRNRIHKGLEVRIIVPLRHIDGVDYATFGSEQAKSSLNI